MPSKLRIIFIGTPEFGKIILEKLVKYMPSFGLSSSMPSFSIYFRGPFHPVLVITAPDKPAGRKKILTAPPVKILAEEYEIPVLQPEKIKHYKFTIKSHEPDLIVVAGYSQILSKEILEIPKYGCLNLHPSLLPRWRGSSPIQFTILAGDKEAGVTTILMDEKLDHGPIIDQRKIGIEDRKITYKTLEKELAILGAKLLIEVIPKWISGKIKPRPQEEEGVNFTKILKKEDGSIDWKKSAQEIERQVRALNPWPGTFCIWPNSNNKKIKVLAASVKSQRSYGPFGVLGKTFMATNEQIAVQCGKDFLIIEELQMEGKKPMKARDFLNGRHDFIGKILG